jgi:hypothetical protein
LITFGGSGSAGGYAPSDGYAFAPVGVTHADGGGFVHQQGGGGLADAYGGGFTRGPVAGGFTNSSGGMLHGAGSLTRGQEVVPSTGAGGIAYKAAGEGSFFLPSASDSATNTEGNLSSPGSFTIADPAKRDIPTLLTGSLPTQQEPPRAGKGEPANVLDSSASGRTGSPNPLDPAAIGTTDLLSQSDVGTLSEGEFTNDLDPSAPGTNQPMIHGELATITQSDSPAQVDRSAITQTDRPTKDDLSTPSKGDRPAQDNLSPSADDSPMPDHRSGQRNGTSQLLRLAVDQRHQADSCGNLAFTIPRLVGTQRSDWDRDLD